MSSVDDPGPGRGDALPRGDGKGADALDLALEVLAERALAEAAARRALEGRVADLEGENERLRDRLERAVSETRAILDRLRAVSGGGPGT